MRKITLISISIFMLLALSLSFIFVTPIVKAENDYDFVKEQEYKIDRTLADKILQEFSVGYTKDDVFIDLKDRTAGSEGEKKAAEYLANKFHEYKLTGLNATKGYNETFNKDEYFENFTFTYGMDNKKYSSQNVVGLKKSAKKDAKAIYIGAHIDNYYGFTFGGTEGVKSNGASDNGTGVATMLIIADAIKDLTLDFDVVFVGFGAEEVGYCGSIDFVERLKFDDIENALLMINLDSVAAGDNLYLYTNEKETYHEKYMHKVAGSLNIDLKSMPNKKDVNMGISTFKDIPYTHMGMQSDHSSFYNVGILVANFFAYNMDLFNPKESSEHENIIHTGNDTYEVLNEYYGEKNENGEKQYVAKMNGIADIVLSTMLSTNFETVLTDSKEALPYSSAWNNKWIFFGIGAGVLAIVVIVLILWFKSSRNKNPNEPIIEVEEIKTDDNIFGGDFGTSSNENKKPEDKIFDDF